MKRALVVCESFGRVRNALRAVGVDAYSNDLLPAADGSPFHIQGDARAAIERGQWDLLICHPPCTYLCNSGVSRLRRTPKNPGAGVAYGRARWLSMRDAARFFNDLLAAPIEQIAIENPVQHSLAGIRRHDQTVQPYQFGDDASKRTCLWLNGLPKLVIPHEEKWIAPRMVCGGCGWRHYHGDRYSVTTPGGCVNCGDTKHLRPRWGNQTDSGQNKETPSADRWQRRSITYPGIAAAMAAQWGGL